MKHEFTITSAVVVQPGDKVLLTWPTVLSVEDAARIKEAVQAWAPEADWLVLGGAEVVLRRKQDQDAA